MDNDFDDLLGSGPVDSAANNLALALKLASQGFPVFPCREKAEVINGKTYSAKSPIHRRGLYDATTKEKVIRRWWSETPHALVGFPTGQLSGIAVLDLDRHTDESDGVAALKSLGFEYTELSPIMVRTAGGGIHLYFKWREGLTNRAQHLPAGIDIRGKGGLIIAPGSMFPDGRLYSPAEINIELPDFPEKLMPPLREEREPVAVCEATEWQKEQAWDMIIALADRVRSAPQGRRYDTLRDASFWAGGAGVHGALDLERTKAYLTQAAKECGLDKDEIAVTFKRGWTDGFKKPVELPEEYVVEDDFDDLSDEDESDEFDDVLGQGKSNSKPTPKQIKHSKEEVEFALGKDAPSFAKRLNKKHALARVSSKTVVMDFHPDGRVTYGNVTDLHAFYENDTVKVGETVTPVTKLWMKSKYRRSYPNGIIFAPNKEVEGAYNHWQGFSVEESSAPDPSRGCKLFLKHLREVVCAGDEEIYRYHLGWLAHMIQMPEDKPGVAIIYKGRKRIGKDTVFEYVGRIIKNHYITVANQEQMIGKFNAHQEKALLLHMQEGFWAGNKQSEGMLKYLITSTQVMIEPKGMNAFPIPSVLRIFISSNEEWVVPASEDEARFLILDVSEKRRNDHTYFAALREEMDGDGPSALLAYLQQYDISKFQVRAVPNTNALSDQKIATSKNVKKWWYEVLQQGFVDPDHGSGVDSLAWERGTVRILKRDLRHDYALWMRPKRFDGEVLNEIEFGRALLKMCPSIVTKQQGQNRKWVYVLPDLGACRIEFDRFMGGALRWPNQPNVEIEPEDEDDL